VLSASLYITSCSAKNRLRARLRRLREPRYLIGAIAGIAYFYFAIFAPRGRRAAARPGRNAPDFGAAFQMTGTSLGGLFVMLAAALPWVLPSKSKLLQFSDAEKDFLFAAPVTRRALLAHRILRSQIGSLIASLFIGLFAAPLSGPGRLRLAAGFWLILATSNIYFAAVQLTRARLQSSVGAVRAVAWVPIGLLAAGLVVVGSSVARQLMQPAAGAADVFVRLSRVTSAGLPKIVLSPFVAVIRPPFSTAAGFFPALVSAVAVLILVTAWMLMSDAMFDEVAGQGGGPVSEDQRKTKVLPARVAKVGWTLPLHGRPELALMWKGSMETMRGISAKSLRYLAPALFGVGGAAFGILQANRLRGPAAAVSIIAGIVAVAAVVFGPQIARSDLRTDFEHLDLLKTWPLRAADVIRGEMLWPAILVSSILWMAVLVAAVFSAAAAPGMPFFSRVSFALTAAIAGPALIAAQYAVHATFTIFFPAWVQIGSQRTRGIDAMGQRLIMLLAIVVSLALFALPGALGGGVVWLIFRNLVGNVVFVPAAIVFAAIVLVEVLAVTELLGPAYERIDVTSVERAE